MRLLLALTIALTLGGCTWVPRGGPDAAQDPQAPAASVSAPAATGAPPTVGPRERAAIRRFLRAGGTAAGVADLQAELATGLTARAEDVDGVTGVAVTARPGGEDCAVGRRDRAGRVSVWHPPRIQTMPGELGCVPMMAIAPPDPPH